MEKNMNEKNPLITNEELIYSNMLQTEALLRVLINKGITTMDEVMNEVTKLQSEMQEKIKKNSLEN